MKKQSIKILVSILIIISSVIVSSASSIVINSDKTLSIEGIKTFPTFVYGICVDNFGAGGTNCAPSPLAGYATWDQSGWVSYPNSYATMEAARAKFEATSPKVYWQVHPMNAALMTSNDIASSHFFGYIQKDEPATNEMAVLTTTYNTIKAKDPNHPVILNLDPWKPVTMIDWQGAADIITYDIYRKWTNNSMNPYGVKNFLYSWEASSKNGPLKNNKVSDFSKPVYAVLQSNGKEGGHGKIKFLIMTPDEVRAETYLAITLGFNGVGYWSYHQCCSLNRSDMGFYVNSTLTTGMKTLMKEIKSINNYLVSPTAALSYFNQYDDTHVTFSPNPTQSVPNIGSMRKLNYNLKYNNGDYLLIVVNKDPQPVSNIQITIPELAGKTTQAKYAGLWTTGSGSNQNLPKTVVDGIFTDSFDGYAVHLYEIAGTNIPTPAPAPSPVNNELPILPISIIVIAIGAFGFYVTKKKK